MKLGHSILDMAPSRSDNIFHNVPIDKAELIFLPQNKDRRFSMIIHAKLIHHVYDGHLILIDFVPMGQAVDFASHHLFKHFKGKVQVSGWDTLLSFAQETNMKIRFKEFIQVIERIQRNIPVRNKGKLVIQPTSLEQLMKHSQKNFGGLQVNDICSSMTKLYLEQNFKAVVQKVNELVNLLFVKYQQEFNHANAIRQAYLKDAILRGIKSHGKVIVLSSKRFFTHNRKFECYAFLKFIKTRRYFLFTSEFSELNFAKVMSAISKKSKKHIPPPSTRRGQPSTLATIDESVSCEKTYSEKEKMEILKKVVSDIMLF